MNIVRVLAVAGLVLAAAALSGVAQPEQARTAEAASADRSVTVNGLASVTAVPDQAGFSFGVETQGATAREALAANTRLIQRVVAALRNAGIAQRDIRTSIVSVSPRYAEGPSDMRGATSGFVAHNSVSVTLRELARAGAVIDAAVEAGANVVSGPMLDRSDRDALYRQALRAAVEDARGKAQELAGAAGGSVGRVLTLVEGGGAVPMPYAADTAVAERSAVIEPGRQEIQASVTVTFELS